MTKHGLVAVASDEVPSATPDEGIEVDAVETPTPPRDALDFMDLVGAMAAVTASIALDARCETRERIAAASVAGNLSLGAIRAQEVVRAAVARQRSDARQEFRPGELLDWSGNRKRNEFQPIEYAEAKATLERHARRLGLAIEKPQVG